MANKPIVGEYHRWGHDEYRVYTHRGWVIVSKNELQEELNDIASIERDK